MGAKDSKEQILSYDDAVKRVTKVELQRLQSAYKRCSAFSGILRENIFLRDVLGERVPVKLAQRIFDVMSSSSRGMTCKDLVTILVLLTRGKQQERLRLICAVYSDSNGSYVSRKSMSYMVMACENTSLPHDAMQLFQHSDHISYEIFQDWVLKHSTVTSVTRWLLCSGGVTVSLTDNTEMPNFYQTLAGVTHLEESDIIQLEKHYWSLKSQSKSGQFDAKLFESIVCPPLPRSIVKGLFHAFDENNDNHIDFKEISCGVSACCRGPLAERQKFCFKIFDHDRDGKLNESELKWMGQALLEIKEMCKTGNKPDTKNFALPLHKNLKDLDHGRTIKSPQSSSTGIAQIADSKFYDDIPSSSSSTLLKRASEVSISKEFNGKEIPSEVDCIISSALQFSTDQEGCISLEEYQMWGIDDVLPNLLLNVVIEVCHIALGLRPLTPYDEGVIIRGWMQRSNIKVVKPGETWYIISNKWWKKWKQYTSYDPVLRPNVSEHWEHSGTEIDPIEDNHERTSSTDTISSACEASEGMLHDHTAPGKSRLTLSTSNSSSSTVSRSSSINTVTSTSPVGHPGPIDNSDIVAEEHSKLPTLTDEGGKLKDLCCVGREFEVIPEPVWKALHHWYGGQPVLPRIVPMPLENETPSIELHRTHVTILKHQMTQAFQQPNSTTPLFSGNGIIAGVGNTTVGVFRSSMQYLASGGTGPRRVTVNRATFSCRHTIQQVQTFLSTRMYIHYDNMRLWNFIDENNAILMEEESATIEAFGIKQGSQILVEVRNPDLSWPEELVQLARNNKKGKPKRAIAKGATGLSNLGNTCFMNSAVQCLSNTRPLTKYFQNLYHLYELNKTNPLGMKGHIAKRYSDLINDLWSGNSKSIAPIKLRWTISKYAPRFNGFSQHDSQELLSFLLDGLHEDLNRVHVKPYVELKDSDGRPDEEVAQEAWDNHLMRNQSIIVDLFHGQIKSQVCCLECGTKSVRFDPFTFLSLPLPMDNSMYLDVIFVDLKCNTPVRYGLRLSMEETFLALRTALAKICNLSDENLLLATVHGANIKTYLSDNLKIRLKPIGTLYAFEIPSPRVIDIKTPKVIKNGTVNAIKNSPVEGSPNRLPSSLHESHKTSITNLNAMYNEANDNEIKTETKSQDHPELKVPGIGVRVQTEGSTENVYTNGSSFHCKANAPQVNIEPPEKLKSPCYVLAFHRKTFHQEQYFISYQKNCCSLFGVPIVVPFAPGQLKSELYENVWNQVKRLVSPLPSSDNERNHATDCDESLGSKYPFVLRSVKKCGTVCGGNCPWYAFCRGCLIHCNDESYDAVSGHVAIDWDPTALHLRYQPSKEKEVVNDESVKEGNSGQRRPIDLNECLRAFTTEEDLGADELYYCGKCKTHQLARKKLDIWRLPPILIIHLKRFQYVNGRWTKSHKVVDFPRDSFDPSSFMTKREICESNCTKDIMEKGEPVLTNGHGELIEVTSTSKENSADKNRIKFASGTKDSDTTKRRTSGPARIRQPSFRDEHPLYDLNSISCHSGILGGGHYVTYSKNSNGKWYHYNDSSCREVTPESIGVDSAYILFYERQDIDYEDFMPAIANKKQIDTSNMDEDFDSEYKKVCTIQ